jgi:mannose-6-phosphate isomerase-like protein (cupin superfamily)
VPKSETKHCLNSRSLLGESTKITASTSLKVVLRSLKFDLRWPALEVEEYSSPRRTALLASPLRKLRFRGASCPRGGGGERNILQLQVLVRRSFFFKECKTSEHRHPFTEVRFILDGEMLFNVSGNQFLVRAGDRLEIPANTKHWHQAHGDGECVCIYAQRVV